MNPAWRGQAVTLSEGLGGVWLDGLRMTIIPLVFSLLVVGVGRRRGLRGVHPPSVLHRAQRSDIAVRHRVHPPGPRVAQSGRLARRWICTSARAATCFSPRRDGVKRCSSAIISPRSPAGPMSNCSNPLRWPHGFPWLNTEGVALGSVGLSGEGWFDNVALLNALRRRARSLGTEYVENEVVAITRDAHRIAGVRLGGGQEVGCGLLVNAAGTRGTALAAMAGIRLPVEARRRCVFVLSCPTPLAGVVR